MEEAAATNATAEPTDGSASTTPQAMSEKESSSLNLIYILYFIGFLFPPTALAGFIIAYLRRGEFTDEMGAAHLKWVIRTTWWSILWMVIGVVLEMVIIGFFIMAGAYIWTLYRFVKGYMRLHDGKLPTA